MLSQPTKYATQLPARYMKRMMDNAADSLRPSALRTKDPYVGALYLQAPAWGASVNTFHTIQTYVHKHAGNHVGT